MNVSAHLDRIERYAAHVVSDTLGIVGAVRSLPARPDFETRAEDTLRMAETELMNSLEIVRRELKNYSMKPVTA